MGQPQEKTEVEAELKIRLSQHDLEEVFKTLSKKAAVISHKYLPRAYYDTDDLGLYNAGRSLRVQYKPGKEGKLGGYEQTVKVELPPANDAAALLYFSGANAKIFWKGICPIFPQSRMQKHRKP
jgi:hypothetical protein